MIKKTLVRSFMQKNPVRDNITTYLPGLIRLIGDDNNFGWTKINSNFEKLLAERKAKANGEIITVSTTFFDVIMAAKMKNNSAALMLIFFNSLFAELSNRFTDREKKILWPTIKNILKSKDNRYFEFVGELAVLNNLTSTNLYTLDKVERRLENGKSTDFCLILNSTNEKIHVEVYSIHLDPNKVSGENLAIEKFLTNRINKKIADKSKNIADRDFFLIPIIHGRIESLITYGGYFLKNKLDIKSVTEPLAFMTFSDVLGNYSHKFGRISKIFYGDEITDFETNKTYIDGQ